MSSGGSMIETNNNDWEARCRLPHQHCMSRPYTVRHVSAKVTSESYPIVGYNYRVTSIQVEVGREQHKRPVGIVALRRGMAAKHRETRSEINGIALPLEPKDLQSNRQSYCVCSLSHIEQREVMQSMFDAGGSTGRDIMRSRRKKQYLDSRRSGSLSHSKSAQDFCVVLPSYGQMSYQDSSRVADSLAFARFAIAAISDARAL